MDPEELVMMNNLLAEAFERNFIRVTWVTYDPYGRIKTWKLQVRVFTVWYTLMSCVVDPN